MSNTRARKPGGGRKPSKPEYSAAKNLAQQMKAAADLYTDKMSLQAIADTLSLNPIKVRKLLITAGVYESAMFYRFGLIDVPDDAKRKMNKNGCVSKG